MLERNTLSDYEAVGTRYRRRRLLIILFIILIILVVALGVFGFITVRRSFPQTEGVIQLPGLDASV